MTWWGVVLIAYGGSFIAGVGCYEDGPTPAFVSDWLLFGSVLAVVGLLALWVAT